jgi:uncharacterized membrane protein
MGDMEMIFPDRVKIIITHDGVEADIINMSDCCELCNDPRMVHEGDLVKCYSCGVINHVNFGHAKDEPTPQA